MTREKLNMLKDKLLNSPNFKDAYNFYFDHFGERQAFLNASKPIKDKVLETLVKEVGSQVAAQPQSMLTRKVFLEHKPLGIKHGACFMGSQLLTFFFIKELGMGLLAAAQSPNDPNIKIARFSGEMVGDGVSRFMPPEKEQSN